MPPFAAMRWCCHVEQSELYGPTRDFKQFSCGGSARCEGLWWGQDNGSCARLELLYLSVSLFLPQLNSTHNIKGGCCQFTDTLTDSLMQDYQGVVTQDIPEYQWNVRGVHGEDSHTPTRILGIGTHQQKLHREWSRQQIICSDVQDYFERSKQIVK